MLHEQWRFARKPERLQFSGGGARLFATAAAGTCESAGDMLAGNSMNCALFDTVRFTRDLEQAYAVMWQRHQSGDPPSSFAVEKEHD
jgi:hypothetical protein